MADDGRDYDLSEAQQGVKAKYPPIQKKYECEFLPAAFPARGEGGNRGESSALRRSGARPPPWGTQKGNLPAFMANEIQRVKRSLPRFNSSHFVFHPSLINCSF